MKQFSIFYFFVLALVSINCENGYNAIFDNVLRKFNDEFKAKNMCQMALKDVSVSFKYKVLFIPIPVHITATKGNVQDLCTFKRSGDVILTQTNNSSVTLSLGIDMDRLEINYNDLQVKAIFYLNLGSLKVIINQHAIQGQVTLSMPNAQSCNINLDFVKITSLNDIHIYLYGKDNSKFDKIADGDINSLKQKAISTIEAKIKTILSSEKICEEIIAAGITIS